MVTYTLIVLGSGQDGGTPQVGSAGDTTPERSASCLAVVDPAGGVHLFDASPDLRSQYRSLARRLGARPEIRGVFLTHGHMGHYAGLVHFGKEAAATEHLPLYATRSMLAFLEGNQPWASLFTDGHLTAHPIGADPIDVAGMAVRAIAVPHRGEFTDTVAFSVAIEGRPWFLYLPDIDSWHAWPEAERVIGAHDIALLDATFSQPDELPGRDMEAIAHPLVGDTVSRFGHLVDDTRVILTHINHSNPLGRPDADVTRLVLERGFEVAHDTMVIDRAR